jgi:hypothetical protein
MQQEPILGEESGEQEAVPLLIGTLGDQEGRIAVELTPLRTQAVAQRRPVRVKIARSVAEEDT